jgi:O-antigen ligase
VNRTRPVPLVLFAAAGAAVVWLLEIALLSAGRPAAVPPTTLALALAVIGILDLALAIPIRRAVRDRTRSRIDPFYATRVAVLSKASSLAGALAVGVGVGILIFLLTRSVLAVSSVLMTGATVVGAIVLLVAGLIAEYLCSIPPDDDDQLDHDTAAVRPH